ncbi:insulin-induced protein family, partial [Gaertneriomyces semiglobifer]
RALILFTLGFAFSVIIDHFQQEHDVTRFPRNGAQVFSTASWVTLSCGAAGCLVGTMYPMLDYYLSSTPHACNRDWPSVLRCTAGFIGVNYATAKLTGTDGAQISLALSICAVGLWFMFDRTWYGFLLSLLVAIIGTWAAQFFVSTGFYIFTKADFFGVRSWFPCMLYSGSVLFGSIGRQL